MADSISLPGAFSLFRPALEYPIEQNVSLPNEKFSASGCISSIFSKTQHFLRAYSINLRGKMADIYDVVLTFADCQARVGRFYFLEPNNSLTLKTKVLNGENVITTVETPTQKAVTDCLFIKTSTGLIVRQVGSVVGKDITLVTAVDRDISVGVQIGWCFRSRFNNDVIEIQYETTNLCSVKLDILECLKSPREAV